MSDNFARPRAKKGVTITWRGIVLVVIAVLLIVFGVQNLNSATITFLGFDISVPVWLLVPGTFVLGMVFGGVVKGTARKLRKPHPEVKG